MRNIVLIDKAAGTLSAAGSIDGSPLGLHGEATLLLAYTKGAETSLTVNFYVRAEDGTEHALYHPDSTTLYAPFGTLTGSLATPRAIPVMLGAFRGLPECLLFARATIVGTPSGTSTFKLELQAAR